MDFGAEWEPKYFSTYQNECSMNFSTSSIGIDLVHTEKFKRLLSYSSQRAWRSYFTRRELAYCFRKSLPEIHLAVRFAAKEAIVKAYATMGIKIKMNKIEILSAGNVPIAKIHELGQQYKTAISLSHHDDLCIACALVTLYEN
jgi:holo-[acyl-carrier protein] synthase